MRNIRNLGHLSELSLPHYVDAYMWTAWRPNFSEMSKFVLGFCSVTLTIFFSFGWLVRVNFLERLNNICAALRDLAPIV